MFHDEGNCKLCAPERREWVKEFRRASRMLGTHPLPADPEHDEALARYRVAFDRLWHSGVGVSELLAYASEQVKNVTEAQS